MEQAILKTLKYADLFDYPLKGWEVHKWLLNKKASLQSVEKKLRLMVKSKKIGQIGDYFYLSNRSKVVNIRLKRQTFAKSSYKKATWVSKLIGLIPFVQLVGISGSLAMDNQKKTDDIDLFIITSANKVWLTRLIILTLLNILGVMRRKVDKYVSNKICVNLLLDINHLEQKKKNFYIAHEILQMKPLVVKGSSYSKFLMDNHWVFQFLPNWTNSIDYQKKVKHEINSNKFADFIENWARLYQLRLMSKPLGNEIFDKHSIYFHPIDRFGQLNQMLKKQS